MDWRLCIVWIYYIRLIKRHKSKQFLCMTHSVYYTISLLLHNKNKIWLENGENTVQLSLYAFPSAITEFSYYVLRFFFIFFYLRIKFYDKYLKGPKRIMCNWKLN